jgi:hypothetical protein
MTSAPQPRLFYAMIHARALLAAPYRGKYPRSPARINKIIQETLAPCLDEIGGMLDVGAWTRFPNADKSFGFWKVAYPLGPLLPQGGILLLQIDTRNNLFLVLHYTRPQPITLHVPIARTHTAQALALLILCGPERARLLPSAHIGVLPSVRECHDVLRRIPGWRKLNALQMVHHIRHAYPLHPLSMAQTCVRDIFTSRSKRLHSHHAGFACERDLGHNS